MQLAVSNIGFSHGDADRILARLADGGVVGLEIAPSRVWADTWRGLTGAEVAAYRRQLARHGLVAVGLHSLFFDHPELGLFRSPEARADTLDFLEHLSQVCRDLGGRTLIWGGGRKRGPVPAEAARSEALSFMDELCDRIRGHGTCFCFEPLGPNETDFINSALEALDLVELVNRPEFAVQVDAKALVANNEVDGALFERVSSRLVHFHANEPGFDVLGSSGTVPHCDLGRYLQAIGYEGYVSLEQRQLNEIDPLPDILQSVAIMKACYQ